MKRIVALVGVALVGLLAHPSGADAAEPYDSQIATVLVAPTDPTLVEVLDPAAEPHSGLVAAGDTTVTARLRPEEVAAVRGGYRRAYRDDHRILVATGLDLGAVGAVQSRLAAGLDVGGTPLTVGGATGFSVEEAVRADGQPIAAVGFSVGTRAFAVVLTGDDPDHALLYAHMNAIAAAAVARPADAAASATATGIAGRTTTPAPAVAPATGLAARWSEVVHDQRIDLFLGGAAILLALVLLNRAVNASRHRRLRTTMSQRGSSAGRPGPAAWAPNAVAWPTLGNDRWPSSDEVAFPTLATPTATATAAAVARPAELPIEAYSGQRNIGWGDEPLEPLEPLAALAPASSEAAGPVPEPLPPLPSRSKMPKAAPPSAALLPTTGPTAAAPAVPAAPVAVPPPAPVPAPASAVPDGSPSPWTVSASHHDDEQYSFPGAETWPGDPVGDGRA